MGVNPGGAGRKGNAPPKRHWAHVRPVEILRGGGGGETGRRKAGPEPGRPRHSATILKALDVLGLDETADAGAIKAQYKTLVKRFHPDANGGDRSFEERLRDIIRAHDALRAAGLC